MLEHASGRRPAAHSRSGTGVYGATAFTVPAGTEWDVAASYSCSGITAGWVDVFVYDPTTNHPDLADPEVATKIQQSGNAVGRFHDAGSHYLTITGPCSWSVRAFLAGSAAATAP